MPEAKILFAARFLPSHVRNLLQPRLVREEGKLKVYEVVIKARFREKLRVKMRWAIRLLFPYVKWIELVRVKGYACPVKRESSS